MARNLVRFDPFAELSALQRRFFEDGMFSPSQGMHRPTTDVYTEDDNKLTVEAHLPQFEEGDITVDVDQGALVIQAERHEKTEDTKKKYVVRESSSSFYRRIALPDQADESKINAKFSKGVLKVTVPFKELPTPTKVEITSGS
ncbi:MAG: Hsp20/alpha crystallin family protein [Homoserinimonas sp.]